MREPDAPREPATIGAIEHDLVNSLAAITGFSEVIRSDPSLPDDLRRNAELLLEEATRTRRLVQQLLALARGKAPPTPSPTPDDVRRRRPRGGGQPTLGRAATEARPRVLVLDDEPSMRLFIEKALDLLGYEPVVSQNGRDAVPRAIDGDHAALLFDHQMGGMSGVQACEEILAVRPDLAHRMVLMSGDLSQPELEAFAARHPVHMLPKPFDLDTLDRAIRAAMDARAQSRG